MNNRSVITGIAALIFGSDLPVCAQQSSVRDLADMASATAAAKRELAARIQKEVPGAIQKLLADMVDIPGKPYKACKVEVTQALWAAVTGEAPSHFAGADRPVECVSWNDCQTFLEKLNANPVVKESGLVFRLPTEEEWEHACRAGSTGDYCKLSDGTEITEATLGSVAWYATNSGDETHPVGQKTPNAFGLYDMHGNVWEWTSTPNGDFRVDRGGGWIDNADDCTSDGRDGYLPGSRDDDLGFRLFASAALK